MGKIDKEKLLKEINGPLNPDGKIFGIIKNFPEEPEIDLDALYEEYSKSHQSISLQGFIDFLKSKNLTQPQIDMDQLRTEIYSEIVMSNNPSISKTMCAVCGDKKSTPLRRDDMGGYVCLSCIDSELTKRNTPKPIEIPVKRYWTLKPLLEGFCKQHNYNHPHAFEYEPKHPEFYDLHEEPDYSAIPNWSIVELVNKDTKRRHVFIMKEYCNGEMFDTEGLSYTIRLYNVRIVELAKE